MPPALPRAGVHNARLVQCLAALGLVAPAAAASVDPLGLQLGGWLDWTQAGEVAQALETRWDDVPPPTPLLLQRARWSLAAVPQVRRELGEALAGIVKGRPTPGAGLPRPGPGTTLDDMADYSPYRQHAFTQQRTLQARLDELRAQLRGHLARMGPSGAQMAALDAAWQTALAPREHQLLSMLPPLLGDRYEALRQEHLAALQADPGRPDGPTHWLAPGAWLARFAADLNEVMQAELALRLEPLEGLAAALRHEIETRR